MTTIDKIARDKSAFRRTMLPFDSAREAMKAYLRSLELRPGQQVALPAYVGWSAREGSGVYDPIRELGLDVVFYRVDRRLRLDLESLQGVLANGSVGCVVLIHYFGHVDPSAESAADMARAAGAAILEDEAHAMLTDLVGGVSGRLGDASIYSLHKLLPLTSGGSLVVNASDHPSNGRRPVDAELDRRPFDFDLAGISRRRRVNAETLADLVVSAAPAVEPLWGPPRDGEIPQTFPVLIHNVSRDHVYAAMNELGFGVVSLYHTMIPEIAADQFPDSYALARRILNLPIHQDVRDEALPRMVEALIRVVHEAPDLGGGT